MVFVGFSEGKEPATKKGASQLTFAALLFVR